MGGTPLMCAVDRGHVSVARILLSKGANVSVAADDGCTALLLATQHGHLAITKMLVKAGADIEATTSSEDFTPLHTAAYHGHSKVMKVLIEAGANPDCRTPRGVTPLLYAARRGHVEAIRELLRAEANPLLTGRMEDMKWAPLHEAVQQGHSEVVRELVHQVGIEGCCGGESGAVEALCLAAKKQHVDVMAVLMEAGVVDTGEGLYAAAANGPEASVKLLLEQKNKGETTGGGAYVDFRGSFGSTPLLNCIVGCMPCSPRVARLLVDAGADTTSKVLGTKGRAGGEVQLHSTPLGVTSMCLRDKLVSGEPATEEQLHKMEAIRRLLLQVEAVHAVSWLWPSGITFIAHAAEANLSAKTASTPLMVMLPILRQRARRRGVLLSALFRYSSKPGPGSTHAAS